MPASSSGANAMAVAATSRREAIASGRRMSGGRRRERLEGVGAHHPPHQRDALHEPVGADPLVQAMDSFGLIEIDGEGPDAVRGDAAGAEIARVVVRGGEDYTSD